MVIKKGYLPELRQKISELEDAIVRGDEDIERITIKDIKDILDKIQEATSWKNL